MRPNRPFPLFRGMAVGLSCFAALLIAALSPISFAQNVESVGARVVLNGRAVLSLKTVSVEGLPPAARATDLARRLSELPSLSGLSSKKVGTTAVIMIGDERLLTVTPAEAKAHRSTPEKLAALWVRNLRAAANAPAIEVATTPLRLPTDSTKTLAISGWNAVNAKVTTDRADVATVEKRAGGMVIRARSQGQAVISVRAGYVVKTIEVQVQPYAVEPGQRLVAEVNGALALASTVESAVTATIKQALKTAPGARVSAQILNPTSIPAGEARTVNVRIKADANDAFPYNATMPIAVRNVGRPVRPDADLWYCNDPESLKGPGNLFAAQLTAARPARILYHHSNDSNSALMVRVQIVNDSDEPAKIAITPGDGEPDKNPVLVGYQAGKRFIKASLAGSSEIVTMPPRTSMPLAIRRTERGQTMSGLARLEVISGPQSLLVRADAVPPFPLEGAWKAASESSTPWHEVGARPINDQYDRAPYVTTIHTYPNPFRKEAVSFEVGGRYKYVRIGEKPIGRADESGRLEGNFGVTYEIRAALSNPTNVPADVEIVFEASAGYSGGLFMIGDRLIATNLIQPKAEVRIQKVRLNPGESRNIVVRTIPLSGSSYPATLTLRPVSAMDAIPVATEEGGDRKR